MAKRLIYNVVSGNLGNNRLDGGFFFDADGNGTTSALRIATLNSGLAFTHEQISVF